MHEAGLAAYACDPAQSRGRRYWEEPAPTRTPFQRDRDRIVHSTAFRRLVYKTQVFLNHEGDLFRTRLTHSIEVAQLGRSIARSLSLNEDLVEAICLAHDLGHTPFGHAGQDALHACMAEFGGFEHNLQSLRVVDWLERRYQALAADFLRTGRTPVPCQALNASFFLDPTGTVYPCSMHNRPLGDLRSVDFDFRTLWYGNDRRRVRGEIRREACPHCWTPCEAYQSILGAMWPGRRGSKR